MNGNRTNFLYLNRDNHWPDFEWDGLELCEDGTLRLFSLPLLEGELSEEIATLGTPAGPTGIAVDLDGTIYLSDPAGHRLLKVDACDGTMAPVPCIGGKDGKPVQLNTPRGLLIPKHRRSLFVVDSGNHRIQIFDPDSLQLLDIWGQVDATDDPQPGSEPGRFDTPWTLIADTAGNVYVVDYGNKRVQKFNIMGELIPTFWENMQEANILDQPSDIAVSVEGETIHLYVVDESSRKIFIFDPEGHPVLDTKSYPVYFESKQLQQPMGIVVINNVLYLGDNRRRRILKFKVKEDGAFVFAGEAVGYEGPVAALGLDSKDHLLVHTGTGLPAVALTLKKGYRNKGMLWSQAITIHSREVNWHRLRAEMEELAFNAHLQFFLYTSDDKTSQPIPDPNKDNPFAEPPWCSIPFDVIDLFIGGDPACCLWIGAQFSGDGLTTPVVSQMRVEYNHETYLRHLPAIYSTDALHKNPSLIKGKPPLSHFNKGERGGIFCQDVLIRFLSLFESFFGEVEGTIADLSALFDPITIPKEFLPWLASWLALELDEDWDEATQRQTIAEAFGMYARRGTVEGLRQSLRIYAGVNAIIEEPILNAAWWSLPAVRIPNCKADDSGSIPARESWQAPENSILGFTTMLAPAEAGGAVVGTTAVLDRSHLITQEEFGMPLFEDVAHQFSVQVYRGQVHSEKKRDEVRALLDREKPAHTIYHLCIIEPRMRVGFQARVGIDTIIAGPLPPTKLGKMSGSKTDLILGGEPPGRIGKRSQIGKTTRLGGAESKFRS